MTGHRVAAVDVSEDSQGIQCTCPGCSQRLRIDKERLRKYTGTVKVKHVSNADLAAVFPTPMLYAVIGAVYLLLLTIIVVNQIRILGSTGSKS